PGSTVPFARDPDFIPRDDIVGEIDRRRSVAGSRIALVGTGGVGKSQIAIEYSYRVRAEQNDTWIFWVYAASRARFEDSYRTIASRLGLVSSSKADDDQSLSLVHRWLSDEFNGPWYMIIDNADDNAAFTWESENSDGPALLSFVPFVPHGHVLVTSRNNSAAVAIVGSHKEVVKVAPMNPDSATMLLEKKLAYTAEEENDLRRLVEALECMPLAIVQAAAYINRMAPRMTLQRYLGAFSDQAKVDSLLSSEFVDLRRDRTSTSNAVVKTLQLSFEQINRDAPSAANLLCMMSLFDRQAIQDVLLCDIEVTGRDILNYGGPLGSTNQTAMSDNTGVLGSERVSEDAFESDLSTLIAYNLITVNESGDTFSMHRLVQISAKAWAVKRQSNYAVLVAISIIRLAPLLNWEAADFGASASYKSLIAHALPVWNSRAILLGSQLPFTESFWTEYMSLFNRVAWYLLARGEPELGLEMAQEVSTTIRHRLGETNRVTLWSELRIAEALLLTLQSDFEEAERLHRQVLEGKELLYGPDSWTVSIAMSHLGDILYQRGKFQEGERYLRDALRIQRAQVVPVNFDVMRTMLLLSSNLDSQDRQAEALELISSVATTREKLLGEDHRDTITSKINLA
ncbi:hypothetical protein NA57DRAFT_11860, partial [Rhizodiscina lignyota]